MRVAVTGATGHVGANVVRALLAGGHEIRALCRTGSNRAALSGLDVDVAVGDVLDPSSLISVFAGVDVVINLAAIISVTGDPDGTVMRTNQNGPRNVAAACIECGVGRLVHVSSIHAFKARDTDPFVDETTPPADETCFAYDRSKAAGEYEIRVAVGRGLDAVIVNPTGIMGPHDYQDSFAGQMLRDLFDGRLPALVGAGFDWVDVRDVADAIVTAMNHGNTGENYLLSGTWASTKQVADICQAVSGTPAPRFVLPVWIALIGIPFLKAFSLITGQRPLYTYESLMILKHSNKDCRNGKAVRDLKFHVRPLHDTITDTYEWSKANGLIGN